MSTTAVFVLFAATMTSAEVINVEPGADSIQNALASASGGDELVLADGSYSLSSAISIGMDITIRAQNTGMAVLDGQNSVRVLSISSGNVQLLGLHITRGKWSGGGGMQITGGDVTISNAEITSNTGTHGGGLAIYGGTVTIQESSIYSNIADFPWGGHGGGMYINGGDVTIQNTQITSNTASGTGGGIRINGGTVNIDNSEISSNKATFGGDIFIEAGSVTACHMDTQGMDIDPSAYEWACSLPPPFPPPSPLPPPPLPPPPATAHLGLPSCLCDNFRNGLITDHLGERACARSEAHGLSGYKVWCSMPTAEYIPLLQTGCPLDQFPCSVVYAPPTWPECECDTFVNGGSPTSTDGLCQKKGSTSCFPRIYAGDKKIGGAELYGCPEDMFRCTPAGPP